MTELSCGDGSPMKATAEWTIFTALVALTAFEGLLLYFGQFGYNFNSGGLNPPSLQLGWLFFAMKIVALLVSRRSGLPLLAVGILNWAYGILIFQMHTRHLSFVPALGEEWMKTSFLLLAVAYVAKFGLGRSQRAT